MASFELCRVVLAFAACTLPASADVLVVDAAGGGEYSSLIEALAAADDGDTLLVRPGDYREFGESVEISGRSLSVIGDGAGPVLLNATQISLPLGKRVVLRGLTIEATTFDSSTTGLSLAGGDVFIEGCSIFGRDGHSAFASAFGGKAVSASNVRLVLQGCTLEGGRGSDSSEATFLGAQPGGYGIEVFIDATVAVYGSTITGGAGGDSIPSSFSPAPGNVGGLGLRADFGGPVLVAGTTITGGEGGSGDEIPGSFSASAYAGGDGVQVSGGTTLTLQDSTLIGGAPGVDGAGQPGFPGIALDVHVPASVVQNGTAHRANAFGPPASEGGTIQLDVTGEPGDLFALFLSPLPAVPLPAVKLGFFHLGAPLLGPFVIGPLGPSGSASLSVPAPNLGFGPEGAVLVYQQAFVKPAVGATLLSSPTTLVVVDDSL
jgi:hypothetical protein